VGVFERSVGERLLVERAHQANFFNAVRTRKATVENEVFGNHTAIGCHLANYVYFNKKIAMWDGDGRRRSDRLYSSQPHACFTENGPIRFHRLGRRGSARLGR
jgi:hypothetical protein